MCSDSQEDAHKHAQEQEAKLLHSQEKIETLSCHALGLLPTLTRLMFCDNCIDFICNSLNFPEGTNCKTPYSHYRTAMLFSHLPVLVASMKAAHTKYILHKEHNEKPEWLGAKAVPALLPILINSIPPCIKVKNDLLLFLQCSLLCATVIGYNLHDAYKLAKEKLTTEKEPVAV